MIISFADAETETVFGGQISRKLPLDMQNVGRRKLRQLDAARTLQDMRVPPGNQLEHLVRDRVGQWSVRINDQWRICFRFADGNAHDVEITDYH
jgi:proteic killer suppression protein